MIMRGTTPRMLSWTGLLGVLAVGGLLLPWLPTWAQEREKIEVKVLADKPERPEKPERPGEDREKAAQIEEARNAVKRLTEHLDKMRAEMRETEQQLHRTMERLAELEGRRPGGEHRIVITIRNPDGTVQTIPFPGAPEVLKRLQIPMPPFPEIDVRGRIEQPQERRLDELEKKLDAVLKELEALRKERGRP